MTSPWILAAPPALAVAALLAFSGGPAAAADRHVGYYYPSPSSETYLSRAQTLETASREMRIAFVTGFTQEQFSHPYSPRYSVFAKGDQAEKMIIVAVEDGAISTLYQARALLAQFTAIARRTDFFRKMAVEDLFTFFDLAKLLGFTRITISDGKTYAHQVILQ